MDVDLLEKVIVSGVDARVGQYMRACNIKQGIGLVRQKNSCGSRGVIANLAGLCYLPILVSDYVQPSLLLLCYLDTRRTSSPCPVRHHSRCASSKHPMKLKLK